MVQSSLGHCEGDCLLGVPTQHKVRLFLHRHIYRCAGRKGASHPKLVLILMARRTINQRESRQLLAPGFSSGPVLHANAAARAWWCWAACRPGPRTALRATIGSMQGDRQVTQRKVTLTLGMGKATPRCGNGKVGGISESFRNNSGWSISQCSRKPENLLSFGISVSTESRMRK